MKKNIKLLLIFAVIFLFSFSAVSEIRADSKGKTYHVSPNGSPDGNGSESDPWDLSTANARLRAGDTVILHGGDYETNIHPANSGVEGAPITYIAAEGETPRLYKLHTGLDVSGT